MGEYSRVREMQQSVNPVSQFDWRGSNALEEKGVVHCFIVSKPQSPVHVPCWFVLFLQHHILFAIQEQRAWCEVWWLKDELNNDLILPVSRSKLLWPYYIWILNVLWCTTYFSCSHSVTHQRQHEASKAE